MPRRKSSDLSPRGSIRKRGDMFEVRWYDELNVRRSRSFADLLDAQQFQVEVDRRLRLGQYIAPSELTVQDLIDRYLDRGAMLEKWRPVTLHRWRMTARLHILPTLGNLRVQQVDRSRIKTWMRNLLATYSASLVNNCLSVLNGAFTEAVEDEIISKNPCADVGRPAEKPKPIVTWTRAEVQRIYATVADDPMWNAVYRLFITTGMRQGELRALRWGDISFEAQEVIVRRTMTLDAEGHVIVGSETKTGNDRAIALPSTTVAALQAWQRAQTLRPLQPERDYVFTVHLGKPLPNRRFQLKHDEIIVAAGVKRITPHGMRHTFATLSFERGAHPKIVQEQMGHARIEITLNIYSHVSSDLQRAAAEALDAHLSSPTGAAMDAQ